MWVTVLVSGGLCWVGLIVVAVGWQVWVSLVVSAVLFRVELILVAVVWLV